MDVADPESFLLVVTTNGFGKLNPIVDYHRQRRAGSGVRTFRLIEKTGGIAAARVVSPSQEVMIISADGIIIRTTVKEKDPRQGITVQGRSAQGVRLMRLDEGDQVVAITCFEKEKDAKKAEAEKEVKKTTKTAKNQKKTSEKPKKSQKSDE